MSLRFKSDWFKVVVINQENKCQILGEKICHFTGRDDW